MAWLHPVLLPVLIPLVGAAICSLISFIRPRVKDLLTCIVSILAMILTLASLLPVYNLLRVEKVIVYVVGGAFVIEADYLSFFLMVAVTALSFFVSIFF